MRNSPVPILPKTENVAPQMYIPIMDNALLDPMWGQPMERSFSFGEDLFGTMSLSSNQSGLVALPNCFSEVAQVTKEEGDGPAFPVEGHPHLCQSKGLISCLDCSFNINLQPGALLAVKEEQAQKPQEQQQEIGKTPDFRSMVQVKDVLKEMDLETSVSCHIEYLIKQLYPKELTPYEKTIKEYVGIFNKSIPSTPSCVFSPSGIIFTCNTAFANLVQLPHDKLCSGSFCIFGLFDMASLLSILDMAHKYRSESISGFGRCSIDAPLKTKKLCAASVSTHVEMDMAWIIAQFIPI
ncbi:hypothetical protein EDD86DRAFT_205187 [Gorgonomyces haynaldii]|nr:hypothetical protein EDD86DRAFT_205187 [Gorgonomyces haynaldii]